MPVSMPSCIISLGRNTVSVNPASSRSLMFLFLFWCVGIAILYHIRLQLKSLNGFCGCNLLLLLLMLLILLCRNYPVDFYLNVTYFDVLDGRTIITLWRFWWRRRRIQLLCCYCSTVVEASAAPGGDSFKDELSQPLPLPSPLTTTALLLDLSSSFSPFGNKDDVIDFIFFAFILF
jgi:hypothetical protein